MKTFKIFANGAKMALAAVTMSLAMTSCLSEGDNTYAFVNGVSADCYANSNNAYLLLQSSSAWELKKGNDASWVSFNKTTGTATADVVYISTEPNTTDKYRTATLSLVNADNKSSSGELYQWGTRGDGSLGTAKDVKKIEGSDGSEINLRYDALHRVQTLEMKNGKGMTNNYIFTYPPVSDTARVMTVIINGVMAKAAVNFGWQPVGDIASDDKSEQVVWTAAGSSQVSVKRNENKEGRNVQTVSLTGYQNPDSELSHVRLYYSYWENGRYPENTFIVSHEAKTSNRKQSVDVNQLVFGVDKMNPYILLGFYRYARCSYIYEKLEDTVNNVKYTISNTLNADGSVETLTVALEGGNTITYTFTY